MVIILTMVALTISIITCMIVTKRAAKKESNKFVKVNHDLKVALASISGIISSVVTFIAWAMVSYQTHH